VRQAWPAHTQRLLLGPELTAGPAGRLPAPDHRKIALALHGAPVRRARLPDMHTCGPGGPDKGTKRLRSVLLLPRRAMRPARVGPAALQSNHRHKTQRSVRDPAL